MKLKTSYLTIENKKAILVCTYEINKHNLTNQSNFQYFTFFEKKKILFMLVSKGQLISKANYQAVNSSKKQTNEFVFTTMRLVFIRFLGEIEGNKKTF